MPDSGKAVISLALFIFYNHLINDFLTWNILKNIHNFIFILTILLNQIPVNHTKISFCDSLEAVFICLVK